LIKDDVVAEIKKLKQQDDGNTFVFGSANLSETLLEHALFDEYRLAIATIDRSLSFESLADDIAALLKYLNSGPSDVLGYSLGGGCCAAARDPSSAIGSQGGDLFRSLQIGWLER